MPDRALIAMAIVSGARDGALASLKFPHIDVEQVFLDQDARDVRTKFSKTISTVFFPASEVARKVVVEWVDELRRDLKWGADDPLFPASEMEVGEMTASSRSLACSANPGARGPQPPDLP
jgi:hypothetical protein